jgi:hypothetical protein
LGRQAGGLPVQVAGLPGPSGLGSERSVSVGIPNRRARPEADVVHPVPQRFLIARSGAELAIDGAVNEPTESFSHRERARQRAARAQAGVGGNEIAVENGLDYFARTQFADGHWSLHAMPPEFVPGVGGSKAKRDSFAAEARQRLAAAGPRDIEAKRRARLEATLASYRAGQELASDDLDDLVQFVYGTGEMRSDTAATGLALLTYLGAGYTHLDDKHRTVVRRGVQWLVEHQKPNGELFGDGSKYTNFYSHGIAAIALCEAYGMTQDPELREPARKALDFIVKTQHAARGGWRYEVDPKTGRSSEADTSVSGWQLMALKSGQMAGLDVPPEVFNKIGQWLDSAQGSDKNGRYIYNPRADRSKTEQREGLKPSLAMTGEAMLMRMYLGARRDDRRLVAGAEYLKANLPELGVKDRSSRDCYYWYYATQAMFHMRGEHWDAWKDRLFAITVNSQVQKGDLAGSWHPGHPTPDRWGHAGGRLYVTAMHLLMLEVDHRLLPLFDELRKE